MKNSRKMRVLLVMLIAFAFCFLAEPVKADDRRADHTGSKRQN